MIWLCTCIHIHNIQQHDVCINVCILIMLWWAVRACSGGGGRTTIKGWKSKKGYYFISYILHYQSIHQEHLYHIPWCLQHLFTSLFPSSSSCSTSILIAIKIISYFIIIIIISFLYNRWQYIYYGISKFHRISLTKCKWTYTYNHILKSETVSILIIWVDSLNFE